MSGSTSQQVQAPRCDWRTEAACRGMSVDVFFMEKGEVVKARHAKAICAGCAVIAECLSEAVLEDEEGGHGIRGGLTPSERKRNRRNLRIASGRLFASDLRPTPIAHGTQAGYLAEWRANLPHCAACSAAHSADKVKRAAAKRGAA